MRRRLLVRHFLSQFVENDFSPDVDRHQVLALAAATLITVPMFAAAFMSLKYLTRPLQAPGWTQTTAMGDQMVFCAASLLVSAVVATLEWDALALSPRDAMILGVLPLPGPDIVRSKMASLVAFAGAFVIALNALPAVLHPALMVANLPLNPLMLISLMAAHGLSTMMAGALGFSCVVGLRESLFLCLGQQRFSRFAGTVRSALLFALLVALATVPVRISGQPESIVAPANVPVLLRPVIWFAATHAAVAGRVLDRLPTRDLPARLSAQESRLRTQYRRSLPHLTALAFRGAAVLGAVLTISGTLYLRNARRIQVLPDGQGATTMFGLSRASDRVAAAIAKHPARRAGLLFLVRTMLGSPLHRAYLTASMAAGVALLITVGPYSSGAHPGAHTPVRTSGLAAQTLMLTVMVAGFRAAIRTSADSRASWLFGVAETGNTREFRSGVRLAVMFAIMSTVLLLLPLHAAAWGLAIASLHAVNGAAIGWLLVEVGCASVEQPLVRTIPPSDGLNTVGVVFLGAVVIGIIVLAWIERGALAMGAGGLAFPIVMLLMAACVRSVNERIYEAFFLTRHE